MRGCSVGRAPSSHHRALACLSVDVAQAEELALHSLRAAAPTAHVVHKQHLVAAGNTCLQYTQLGASPRARSYITGGAEEIHAGTHCECIEHARLREVAQGKHTVGMEYGLAFCALLNESNLQADVLLIVQSASCNILMLIFFATEQQEKKTVLCSYVYDTLLDRKLTSLSRCTGLSAKSRKLKLV